MIAEHLGKLSDKFVLGQVDKSYSVGQNNFTNGTIDASKSGYKLLGVIGWQVSGTSSAQAVVFRLYPTSGTTINFYVKNTSTSGGSITQTITVDCLYVKS